MKIFSIAAIAVATLAPLVTAGHNLVVYNDCSAPIWARRVATGHRDKLYKIQPGAHITDQFFPEVSGVSWKFGHHEQLNEGYGPLPISQFEYNWKPAEGRFQYDLSNVDCQGNTVDSATGTCPFM